MADRETFSKKRAHDGDDLVSMATDAIRRVSWKVAGFLMVLMFLVFSDVFAEGFLSRFSGAVHGDVTTNYGTTIQIATVTIGYIIIDLLARSEVI